MLIQPWWAYMEILHLLGIYKLLSVTRQGQLNSVGLICKLSFVLYYFMMRVTYKTISTIITITNTTTTTITNTTTTTTNDNSNSINKTVIVRNVIVIVIYYIQYQV